MQQLRDSIWYDRLYTFSILAKGFDGTVELLIGIWLLLWPASLHGLLEHMYGVEAGWHSTLGHLMAQGTERLDHELYGGVLTMAILFFISHGVIKLILVYALIKRIMWAFPWALGALGLFLVAQVYVLWKQPTLGMAFLAFLDAAIIVIVWGEWQKLKTSDVPHHDKA